MDLLALACAFFSVFFRHLIAHAVIVEIVGMFVNKFMKITFKPKIDDVILFLGHRK